MKKTKIFFLALLCLIGSDIYAQKVAPPSPPGAPAPGHGELKELKVGDMVPNLKFERVLNHPDGEILLSDYRGKLLILDFWATWCAPCVASFPRLDSLDKAFGDQIAILPVTYQDREEVEKLFSGMPRLSNIKKPMIYGDEILRRMFPHQTLPHYVWVNGDGKVVAFSEAKDIDSSNINDFLQRNIISFNSKLSHKIDFDYTAPIFLTNSQVFKEKVEFQVSKSPYVPGVGLQAMNKRDQNNGSLKISLINMPLINIFTYSFWNNQEGRFFGQNRIKISDSLKEKLSPDLTGDLYEKWLSEGNGFNLEFVIPKDLVVRRDEIIQSNLDWLFPEYSVRIEKVEWPVYALVFEGKDKEVLKSKYSERVFKAGFTEIIMEHCDMGSLIDILNIKSLYRYPRPVINQTGIDFPVDINLEGNMFNFKDIQIELKKHQLMLIEKDLEIEVLNISLKAN